MTSEGSEYTVTVVEDNRMNLQLFVDLLGLNGVCARPIIDGTIAFDDISVNVPDLIVMDIQLRDISGIDIIKRLKSSESLAHIPIIAVTAFASQQDEKQLLAIGCSAYIPKPISIDRFMDVVNQYLRGGGGR